MAQQEGPGGCRDQLVVVRQRLQLPCRGWGSVIDLGQLQCRFPLCDCAAVLAVQLGGPLVGLRADVPTEVPHSVEVQWRLRQEEHPERAPVCVGGLAKLRDGRLRGPRFPLVNPAIGHADLAGCGNGGKTDGLTGPAQHRRLHARRYRSGHVRILPESSRSMHWRDDPVVPHNPVRLRCQQAPHPMLVVLGQMATIAAARAWPRRLSRPRSTGQGGPSRVPG